MVPGVDRSIYALPPGDRDSFTAPLQPRQHPGDGPLVLPVQGQGRPSRADEQQQVHGQSDPQWWYHKS